MSYELAIQEAYASAPIDVVDLSTLEIRHKSFIDDAGRPTAIRIVNADTNYRMTLEPDAPIDGGKEVEFIACGFKFTLPKVGEGVTPELKIAIANVSREITKYLEIASETLDPLEVTYRPYLSNDLSRPQMDPPLQLMLSEVSVNVFQATGVAKMEDVHNWPFPNRVYTVQDFPGLNR